MTRRRQREFAFGAEPVDVGLVGREDLIDDVGHGEPPRGYAGISGFAAANHELRNPSIHSIYLLDYQPQKSSR